MNNYFPERLEIDPKFWICAGEGQGAARRGRVINAALNTLFAGNSDVYVSEDRYAPVDFIIRETNHVELKTSARGGGWIDLSPLEKEYHQKRIGAGHKSFLVLYDQGEAHNLGFSSQSHEITFANRILISDLTEVFKNNHVTESHNGKTVQVKRNGKWFTERNFYIWKNILERYQTVTI
jgi:hypothetical protein